MRKMGIRTLIVILTLAWALPAYADAAAARKTVERQVGLILEQLRDTAFKSLDREAQIGRIREIINQVFDYTELSRRSLGKEWKAFNPKQQKEFTGLFGSLLEKTYADRVLAYTSEKIDFGEEIELKEGQVEVRSLIVTGDNRQIPLYYRTIFKDGQWRVYDVVIEGISLVQNYRSQFREILAKQSPDELIRFLRDKTKND